MYQVSSDEHEQALQKYLRLPARKEYEPQRKLANEECYAFKKKFHHVNIKIKKNILLYNIFFFFFFV